MGLSVWLAAKNSRLGFQGSSFKGGDALEDALPLKSVLCHVGTPANTVSAESPSCIPRGPRPPVSISKDGGVGRLWHHQTCAPEARSAQLVPRYVLCPEWFGRAGVLAGHSGSGASLAQPGEGPGTNIILPTAGAAAASPSSRGAASASLQQHRPGLSSEDEKTSLFLNIAATFMGV